MNGTITDCLRGKKRIHLDTMTVIYFIERKEAYQTIVRPVFARVDAGRFMGISSYITLIEVLVQPLRRRQYQLANQYKVILAENQNFALFPVDRGIAEEGARIRAKYGFKTPDAIQLATALHQNAEAFVTNDKALKGFEGIQVLLLDDFLPEQPKH